MGIWVYIRTENYGYLGRVQTLKEVVKRDLDLIFKYCARRVYSIATWAIKD
jgi:hypothetical protein